MEVFYINQELENTLTDKVGESLIEVLKDVKAKDVLFVALGPDYSAGLTMRLLHKAGKVNGSLSDMIFVDLPFPGEEVEKYKGILKFLVPHMKSQAKKVVFVEAGTLTGNNFTWVKETCLEGGYSSEDIITVSLVEMNTSKFKCDIVGQHIDAMPEFWWEADLDVWK